MTCPHCSAPIVADARFCPSCGKATAPTEAGASWPAHHLTAPDLVGREIAGRYRIVKKLGEGGMGAVYRGEQMSLKRAVAVKLLKPEVSNNQLILQRFNAEAQAVAKLSHPNTVNIYDFGQDADGTLFIAMEYIDGRSLREALQKEGPFSPQRALAIALQLAASLSDAHAHSIVHRDLKPDNVMLQERGRQRDVVRVLDFGIAKLRDDSRATQQAMTQAGDMLGTPQYMAPEQIKGDPIDGRTDIYALGCLLYEMVTGRLPYEAPTVMAMLSKHLVEDVVPPTQRRPDLPIPPVLDQLVVAAMAKEPAHRPPTMDVFADLMGQLFAQLPPDSHVPRTRPSAPTPSIPTPVAPSSFGAMPFPGPATRSPVIAPTTRVQAYTETKSSRAPLYAILGLLVIGGAGAGIYVATRPASKPTAGDVAATNVGSAHPATDPWATSNEPSPPVPHPSTTPSKPLGDPTGVTPVPSAASMTPPTGFTEVQHTSAGIGLVSSDTHETIIMAPLIPGTNDPQQLAETYAKQTGATLADSATVESAGAERPMFMFTQDVSGVAMRHIAVLYISAKWRVGVLYIAPQSSMSDLESIEKFFRTGVHLP